MLLAAAGSAAAQGLPPHVLERADQFSKDYARQNPAIHAQEMERLRSMGYPEPAWTGRPPPSAEELRWLEERRRAREEVQQDLDSLLDKLERKRAR